MITVYSKPACPQCDATKRHLTTKGIPHQVIDVSIDPAALATVRALGYSTVPVVVYGDTHFKGFRPDMLDAMVSASAAA
ncbi:MAG: glutaredoxin family protein [Mycobacterium sp.]|nr:MAG: glutaredoxin family protein [Mycobacterium sp.]